MDAPIRNRVRVAVFYQASLRFEIYAIQKFGPNVVSFQMETGEKRCYIMGCYLAPDNTLIIEIIIIALRERPRGTKLLVAEDFNADLAQPEGTRIYKDIVAELAAAGLEDMSSNFLLRRRPICQDVRT